MIWLAILKYLGSAGFGALTDAYKAKLAAGNTADKIAADLAAKELDIEQREKELAVQMNIADEGRWWTAAPRAIATWAFAIFIVKVVVWDKVFGWGTTLPLSGDVGQAFIWLCAMWFGGRSAEKIARILRR